MVCLEGARMELSVRIEWLAHSLGDFLIDLSVQI